MDAKRQVERTRFLIDREKVWIGYLSIEVESALENTAGAVLFRPAQFLDGFVGTKQRQHRGPSQTSVCPRAFLGKPAVVRRCQSRFGFGVIGIVPDEECGEYNLHINAHLVHVRQTARHILKLSKQPRRMIHLITDGAVLQPAFYDPAAAGRRVIAGALGFVRRHRNRNGDIFRVRCALQRSPGLFAFVYMRIGIDH